MTKFTGNLAKASRVTPLPSKKTPVEKLDFLTREFQAKTPLDDESLTISAIVVTTAGVWRRDAQGPYLEVIDISGMRVGQDIPLLDNHRQDSSSAVIGRVSKLRKRDDRIEAEIRFSTASDAQQIVERVRDGTLTDFSAGYAAHKVRTVLEDGIRKKIITVSELREVSIVAVPADPSAKRIRSEDMENEDITTEAQPNAKVETRKAIRVICRNAGMTSEQADDMIDRGLSEIEARAEAFEAMQKSKTPAIKMGRSSEDPAEITKRKTDALAYRMAGGDLPEASREYADFSFKDLAMDGLTRAGESTRGLSSQEIYTRAATHTTSDFPLVVSNAANKVALAAYKAAESPLKTLAKRRTHSNFKINTSARMGGMGRLAEMSEAGEFQHTSRAETGEGLALSSYGSGFGASHQLLIDDDANLLGDIVSAIGQAAAQTEADLLVEQVTGNPAMSDGNPVFHASRNNIQTGADISLTALDAVRKSFHRVTDLDGETIIGAQARILVVGPDQETDAQAMLTQIYAASVDDVNPFSGKLTLIVEPRIVGNAWYVFADPARLPTLQYAYLSGAEGVQIQRREAWSTRGIEFRAFLDFGCGWLDWRGAQYNPGE